MDMKTVLSSETLYKIDSKGKTRAWYAETGTDGTRWAVRSIAGLEDGKKVTSEWTFVEQKNVGRSNETSLEEQATAEMLAEVKKKEDRGYFTNRDRINTFDKFKPMLAHGYEEKSINWATDVVFAQPKLDGIRCIARADGLWTRAGKQITSVPHIWELVGPLFEVNPQLVLDGELYNHSLRDNFNEITSIVRKEKPTADEVEKAKATIQYHVYDALFNNNDSQAFVDRQSNLNSLLDDLWDADDIKQVETVWVKNAEELDELYGEWLELGYEGQMIRQGKSKYENKRSKYLLKRKEFLTDEFKVVSIEEGLGNWAGCVKRFVLQLKDGRAFGAGVRGNQEVLKQLWEGNQIPKWATLRYFTPTPDGIPRFPVVVDWGFGKRED